MTPSRCADCDEPADGWTVEARDGTTLDLCARCAAEIVMREAFARRPVLRPLES